MTEIEELLKRLPTGAMLQHLKYGWALRWPSRKRGYTEYLIVKSDGVLRALREAVEEMERNDSP